MDNRSRKKTTRKKTVIKPAKNNNQHLSRDEVRSINKKKMSKKRKMRRNIFTFFLAASVLCVGLVLVFSLFFKINNVVVEGENIYSDKMVVEKSGIEIGTNLFRVNEKVLSEKLSKELPYIRRITLDRQLPDTLVINVESTRETAAIVSNSVYVLMDETGKILDKNASVLRENVAVVNNVKLKEKVEGEQVVLTNEDKTEALLILLDALHKSELQLLTEIDMKNINNIKVKYDDRITFELGSLTNIETKLLRGKAALEKENEINAYAEGTLDLKTEPNVYFKSGSDDEGSKEKPKKQQK